MHFNVYFLLYFNVFLHSVITPEVKQNKNGVYIIHISSLLLMSWLKSVLAVPIFIYFFAFSIFSIPHVAGLLEENTHIVMNKIIV